MDEINGHIRSWADIVALPGGLTEAEKRLIEAARVGAPCVLGQQVPLAQSKGARPGGAVHIRAPILRYLLLGGCAACPTAGTNFEIEGAHITERLNLNYQTLKNPLRVFRSRFDARLETTQARVKMVNLSKCHLNGWRAQRLDCDGSVFIREMQISAGIDLRGAIIGGQISFSKSVLDIDPPQALIDGVDALNARGLSVARDLIWTDVVVERGNVRFAGAQSAAIWDDMRSWPGHGATRLDGFTYDRIINAATDARSRLAWIAKGEAPGRFFPQPYTQLAKVLREMGHEADARRVMIAKERRHNTHIRTLSKRTLDGSVSMGFRSIWLDMKRPWQAILRWVAGYGYAPTRSVLAILLLITATYVPSRAAFNAGDFAPNSGVIQVSKGWQDALDQPNPAEAWSSETAAGRDWETFHPIAYAADVVIPIIDFGQTDAWAPSTTRGNWGTFLWWFKWVMTLAGWIVTAIGAAAITGIIRRD